MHHYHAWGLRFQSIQELPGMTPLAGDGAPDVTVRHGPVPGALADADNASPWHQTTDDTLLLTIKDVGRFLIERGENITIDAEPDAPADTVRLYLFGSAMGALLHQRGLVTMHASAVLVDGEAVLFTGQSGAGKSTMAFALGQAGYEVLCDDIAVLVVGDDGRPHVLPGLAQQKMWRESLQRLAVPIKDLQPVRPEIQKYYDARHTGDTTEPVPVGALYIIRPGAHDFAVKEITGAAKMMALKNNLYRPRFMEHMGREANMFPVMAAMADRVTMRRIKRPAQDNSIPLAMTAVMNARGVPA